MDEASQLCRWMTCDHEALPGGYLCEEHLGSVLRGRQTTRDIVTKIAAGLTIGVAGNALYQALITAFDGIGFKGSSDRPWPPDVFRAIAETLKADGNLDAAVLEVSRAAAGDEFLDRCVACRLQSILSGQEVSPFKA